MSDPERVYLTLSAVAEVLGLRTLQLRELAAQRHVDLTPWQGIDLIDLLDADALITSVHGDREREAAEQRSREEADTATGWAGVPGVAASFTNLADKAMPPAVGVGVARRLPG